MPFRVKLSSGVSQIPSIAQIEFVHQLYDGILKAIARYFKKRGKYILVTICAVTFPEVQRCGFGVLEFFFVV